MKKLAGCIGTILYCSFALTNLAGAAEKETDDKRNSNMYLGVEVRAWFPKLSGQETRTSQLDFHNDLGHKNKELNTVKLAFTENSKWRAGYDSYSFTGNKTALSHQSFGGQEYFAGDEVHSEKKLTYWGVNFLPNYQKSVDTNFSWLIGIKGYKMRSSVDVAGAQKAEHSYNAVVPALGARYEWSGTRPTTYYAELSGLPDYGKGYNYDVELGVHHQISPNAALLGGYRWLTINAESTNDQMKLQLKGPFVQMSVKL